MTTWQLKFFLLFTAVVGLFLLISGRILFLSVENNQSTSSRSFLNNSSSRRSTILDRNGTILAGDIQVKTLYLNTELLDNEEFVAEELARILKLNQMSIHKKLIKRNPKYKYILIRKYVLPREEQQIKQLPIASIVLEEDYQRFYPQQHLFSHVVGYVDVDNKGILGLEEYYDDFLRNGSDGPLKTTLDIHVQNILWEELQKAEELYRPNFLVGIVTEVKTGNILGLVSLPDFDPNNFQDRKNTFNHATYGGYELGSVFKIFTIANGLELGVIKKDSEFNVDQQLNYGKFIIRDINSIRSRRVLNTAEVFMLSSNVGTVLIAKKIGIERQLKFFENLGLLEKLQMDTHQVSLPLQPRKWKDINLSTIAYGYGLATSPLHILNAFNGIVNDGLLLTPRLAQKFPTQKKMRVISSKTSKVLRNFLRSTVNAGTGRLAYIDGYDIGGKTGTARKISVDGYHKGFHIASFLGAFPMEDPQYSLIVVLDRPKDKNNMDATGGGAAAILTRNLIVRLTPFLENLSHSPR